MFSSRPILILVLIRIAIAPSIASARPQNIYGVGQLNNSSGVRIGRTLSRIPRATNLSGVRQSARIYTPRFSANLSGVRSARVATGVARTTNPSGVRANMQNSFGVGRGYFGSTLGNLPANRIDAFDSLDDVRKENLQLDRHESLFPKEHDHSDDNFTHF